MLLSFRAKAQAGISSNLPMIIFIKQFKELTLPELYTILKLRVDVFVVEQNCPYPELDNEDQKAVHLFIKEEGKVVSYLRIITTQAKTRIGRVLTHKDHRDKKLSSKLMKEVMRYSKQNYPNKPILLSAQEHLQYFYGKFGFVPISKMYLEDGIPHVDMEYNNPISQVNT